MDNRRNFYRILRVQPDASREVIQHSYRSLMQKLQLHPDLGGEQWDASIVNQAYTTLRDPKKRAEYDIELLDRYNIKTLSAGGWGAQSTASAAARKVGDTSNLRNYYRVLHVQPDAEPEVIKASYRALLKLSSAEDRVLIEEAFAIVSNAEKRAHYDRLLAESAHFQAVDELDVSASELEHVGDVPGSSATVMMASCGAKTISSDSLQCAIRQFCHFCKTPYSSSALMDVASYCGECASPLSSPADSFANAPRRSLVRMQQSAPAVCYEFWPSAPVTVAMEDLSPAGLNFVTAQQLEINQVVKVDASQFKSVAEVVHCAPAGSRVSVGARFVTVEFTRQTGSFFSTSA